MTRTHFAGKLLAALMLSASWIAVAAPSTSALTRQTGCGELQSTIDEVALEAGHGEGETIVLSGLCDASSLKSSNGVTLPAGSNLSIEGQQGTESGFEGTGIDGPLLATPGTEEAGAITLTDLTFRHASLNGASALSVRASRVTLLHDSFLEDDEQGAGAHAAFVSVGGSPAACPSAEGPTAIALIDSTFTDNRLALGSIQGGGAGAWLQDECEHSRNVLEGDTFAGNVLEAKGTPLTAQVTGAGLFFLGGRAPASVSQSGDVFDSNELLAPAPDVGDYAGGGEWLENVSLFSVGDRFSRNTIAGTSSSSYDSWSWGAGLAISNLPFACSKPAFPESTLENAVMVGNAIGPGMEADLGGGGVWVGCTHLRVLDSTITLNSAPYGSGIEGEPGDQLELANSIVALDSPGSEVTGFQGEAGSSLSATFSDVCAAPNAPLEGAGNICVNPQLADGGNPASFDVRETGSSPTIDAGANALVPAGLTSDFYGGQRILSGRTHTPACTPPEVVMPTLDPPVVDMGASEYGPIMAPMIAIACETTPRPQTPGSPNAKERPGGGSSSGAAGAGSGFAVASLVQHADGELAITVRGLSKGRLRVRGSFELTDSLARRLRARRGLQTLPYGQVAIAISARGARTLYLKPDKEALQMLAHSGRLSVALAITFTATGSAPRTRHKTIIVVFRRERAR